MWLAITFLCFMAFILLMHSIFGKPRKSNLDIAIEQRRCPYCDGEIHPSFHEAIDCHKENYAKGSILSTPGGTLGGG